MTGCGGQAFVLSDASGPGDASTGAESGPTIDAAPDASASPDSDVLLCNPMNQPCQYGSTCCTGTSATAASASCTKMGGSCIPCATSLRCTSDANCQATATPRCCVGPMADTTCSGNEFFQSVCRAVCLPTETRMCDPTAASSTCPTPKTCSGASGDVQKWGLPQGIGYGVCM